MNHEEHLRLLHMEEQCEAAIRDNLAKLEDAANTGRADSKLIRFMASALAAAYYGRKARAGSGEEARP